MPTTVRPESIWHQYNPSPQPSRFLSRDLLHLPRGGPRGYADPLRWPSNCVVSKAKPRTMVQAVILAMICWIIGIAFWKNLCQCLGLKSCIVGQDPTAIAVIGLSKIWVLILADAGPRWSANMVHSGLNFKTVAAAAVGKTPNGQTESRQSVKSQWMDPFKSFRYCTWDERPKKSWLELHGCEMLPCTCHAAFLVKMAKIAWWQRK